MAKQLTSSFSPTDQISQTYTIESWHVSQSVDALTGREAYDITISGSLTITGSAYFTEPIAQVLEASPGTDDVKVTVYDSVSGVMYYTQSYISPQGVLSLTASLSSSLATSIDALSSSIATRNTTDETNLSNLSSSFVDLSGSVYTLSGSVYDLSGSFIELSASVYTLSGSVYDLSGSVTNISSSFSSSISLLSGSIASRNTTDEQNLANLSSSFETFSGSVETLSGSLSTRLTGDETRIQNLEGISGSFLVTSSISNATITFEKQSGDTYNLTVNNVVSSSYALTASYSTAGAASLTAFSSSVTSRITDELISLAHLKSSQVQLKLYQVHYLPV